MKTVEIILVHKGDHVAWYENGELLFNRSSEDFLDSVGEFEGKHVKKLEHRYVTEKGYNLCDGGFPDSLSDFGTDGLE